MILHQKFVSKNEIKNTPGGRSRPWLSGSRLRKSAW